MNDSNYVKILYIYIYIYIKIIFIFLNNKKYCYVRYLLIFNPYLIMLKVEKVRINVKFLLVSRASATS